MNCTSLSISLNLGIQCTGLYTNQLVTVSSLSNIQIPAYTTLQFSINGLFSPPT